MVVYVVFGGMLATTWVQIIKAGHADDRRHDRRRSPCSAKFDFNPSQLLDNAAAEHDDGKAILGPGTYLTSPVLVISTGLTIFIGTAGLPHILMRFFTVPGREGRAHVGGLDDRHHRRSFTVLVTIIGFGARAILGAGRARGGRQGRQPRRAAAGRSRSAAATGRPAATSRWRCSRAAAFATILAVVAGLVIASAGAIAHDLWTNVLERGDRGERAARRRGSPRSASASCAILATLRDRLGLQRHRAREHGVRVRGERELPAAAAGAAAGGASTRPAR